MERILAASCGLVAVAYLIKGLWIVSIAFGMFGFALLFLYEIRVDIKYILSMSIFTLSRVSDVPIPTEFVKELEEKLGKKKGKKID